MKTSFWTVVVCCFAIGVLAGCGTSSPSGETCLSDADCEPDEQCLGGRCKSRACSSDADCAPGKTCEEGTCTDVTGCVTDADCNGAK